MIQMTVRSGSEETAIAGQRKVLAFRDLIFALEGGNLAFEGADLGVVGDDSVAVFLHFRLDLVEGRELHAADLGRHFYVSHDFLAVVEIREIASRLIGETDELTFAEGRLLLVGHRGDGDDEDDDDDDEECFHGTVPF